MVLLLLPLIFFLLPVTPSAQEKTAPINTEWTLGPQGTFLLFEDDGFHALEFVNNCSSPPSYYLSVTVNSIQDESCSVSRSVWEANRDFPVSGNATLTFGEDGNLVLSQGGLQVWSSNTSGRGAVAMEIRPLGNLVIVGGGGEIIWQSFDHPTDTFLVNQKFTLGSKLVSSVSPTDKSQGTFFLELQPQGLVGRARAPGTAQTYVVWDLGSQEISYLMIKSCYLIAFNELDTVVASKPITSPFCLSFGKFARLHYDGDLRFWHTCACLDFDPSLKLELIDKANPSRGCSLPDEMSLADDRCNNSGGQIHDLVEAPGYDYLPLDFMQGIPKLTANACKKSCLLNCTCVAAFFRQFSQDSACYHVTTLYTVAVTPLRPGYASLMFLKIRNHGGALPPGRRSAKALRIVANTAIGAFSVIIAVSVLIALIIVRWRRKMARISAVDD